MQYGKYKRRIMTLAKLVGLVRRYRVLLSVISGISVLLTGGFLGFKGMVYDKTECPSEVIYGNALTYEADAWFAEVEYEYSVSEDFAVSSEAAPSYPGSYYVRAYSTSAFGTTRHGDTHAFTIVKREVSVSVKETEIVYGEAPTVKAELPFGDTADATLFHYDDVSKPKTNVWADVSSVRIFNTLGEDVTFAYEIETPKSEISFLKRSITVTVQSIEKIYDGKPLSLDVYEITEGTLADFGQDRIDSTVAVFDTEITDVGSEVNAPTSLKILSYWGSDVTARYDIKVVAGELRVDKRPIIIEITPDADDDTPDVVEFGYDGKSHSYTEYKISDETPLAEGHSEKIYSATTVTEAGRVPNLLTFRYYDEAGNDVTDNYYATFIPNEFFIKIVQRDITIASGKGEWVYNGEAHYNKETEVTKGTLVDGHFILLNFYTEVTVVGTVRNVIEAAIYNPAITYQNHNYNIIYDFGDLTVTPRKLTVETHSNSWEYDGITHKELEFDIVGGEGLAVGDSAEAVDGTGITDVRESKLDNELTMLIKNPSGQNVTGCYDITFELGELEITPRPVSVITETKYWIYDAQRHSAVDWSADGSKGLVDGHISTSVDYPFVVDVSDTKTENKFYLTVKDRMGADKTDNYKFSYEYGEIYIIPRPVSVLTLGGGIIYNGEAQCLEKWRYADGNEYEFLIGDEVKVSSHTEITDVSDGEVDNVLTLNVFRNNAPNDKNYDITYYYSKIHIDPRPITVDTPSRRLEYNGEYQSDIEWDYAFSTEYKIVDGETSYVSSFAKVRDVMEGKVKNELVIKFLRGGLPNDDNYTVIYNYGTLEIIPRDITVITDTNGWVYDGDFHYDDDWSVHSSSKNDIVQGERGVVTSHTEIRDVMEGEVENKLSLKIVRGNENISENYAITYIWGTLKILKRAITVITESNEWTYDGEAHFDERWDYASDTPYKIVEVKTSKVTSNTKVTNVFEGEVENELIIEVFRANVNISENYEITYVNGKLHINPLPIYLTTATNSWIYDGEKHFDDTYEYDDGSAEFLDAHRIELVDLPPWVQKVSDGVVDNDFTLTLTDERGVCMDENYDVHYTLGTIRITEREITVITGTNEWLYDGDVHSEQSFKYAPDTKFEIVASDSYDFSYYPTVQYVWDGEVTNDLELAIKNSEGEDVTDSYEIVYKEYGTIQIHKSPITILTDSNIWEYDGESHYDKGYTITSERGLGIGDRIEVDYYTVKDPELGKVDNVLEVIMKKGTLDVTENYAITYELGTLEIIKRKITLQANSALKIYDGTPLTEEGYELIKGEIPKTHRITSIELVGSQTDVGISPNVIRSGSVVIYFGAKNVTAYYEITLREGTLEVIPRKITVTAADASKRCDGTPLTSDEYEVGGKGLAPNQSITLSNGGSQTEIGKSPNFVIEESFVIRDAKGKDVTSNYIVTFYEGELEVLPAAVIEITTESDKKVYDGAPLTCDKHSVLITDGEISAGHTLTVKVTGSRTEIGQSDNTVEVDITDGSGKSVKSYYQIEEFLGLLVVEPNGDETAFGGRLDESGDISFSSGQEKHVISMHLKPEKSGLVYMRLMSYGNYVGSGFSEACEYGELIYGEYGYNYLSGIAMKNKGLTSYKLLVQSYVANYVLPYYLATGNFSYEKQTSDVKFSSENSHESYSLDYYYYGGDGSELAGALLDLSDEELLYREFVYENYLDVDGETSDYFGALLSNAGISASDSDVKEKVVALIQSMASYNTDYNRQLNSTENVVISFLEEYKEGVCQHFAAAATMALRTLGIPARYTIGFAAEVKAGEWNEVRSESAHAWVEVYVDGVGWIVLEATPSMQSDDGSIGDSETVIIGENIPKDILIRPVSVDKVYDGTPLYAKNELYVDEKSNLAYILSLGYTYKVEVSGMRVELGVSHSIVSEVQIFDPDGNDVTSQFNLTVESGFIRVTKTQIVVVLYEVRKTYDGTPISYLPDDYWIKSIPEGYTLEFELRGSMTGVGVFYTEELYSLPYRVFDDNGNEVTDEYFLKFEGVGIIVDEREINLATATETKEYDGTPLENTAVTVTLGTLAEGDTLEALATGSITDIGWTSNGIDEQSLRIVNSDGVDVTDNYLIKVKIGRLTVTAD